MAKVSTKELVRELLDLYEGFKQDAWVLFFMVVIVSLLFGPLFGLVFGVAGMAVVLMALMILKNAGIIILPHGLAGAIVQLAPPFAAIGVFVGILWAYIQTFPKEYEELRERYTERMADVIDKYLAKRRGRK